MLPMGSRSQSLARITGERESHLRIPDVLEGSLLVVVSHQLLVIECTLTWFPTTPPDVTIDILYLGVDDAIIAGPYRIALPTYV